MERKLASIRRISEILPIEGADKIELAIVDGWQVVVAKNEEHQPGDLIIFYEVDSLLPIKPEYEFLRKGCYVANSVEGEGFRLKSIKLRKQLSQGLIMNPANVLPNVDFYDEFIITEIYNDEFCHRKLILREGDDVTELLGVKKYEKILPAHLRGVARGNFPSYIPKTDCERIQNFFKYFNNNYRNDTWEATIKMDGTSFTAYLKDDRFGVCSRNLDLENTEGNLYWEVARKYDIENKLKDYGKNIAIQGEAYGLGINGNNENLDRVEFAVFNVFFIDEQRYATPAERLWIVSKLGLNHVKILGNLDLSNFTLEDFLNYAEGPSLYVDKREGVVFKSHEHPEIIVKAISNTYLLAED